jgi:hypothetical protein
MEPSTPRNSELPLTGNTLVEAAEPSLPGHPPVDTTEMPTSDLNPVPIDPISSTRTRQGPKKKKKLETLNDVTATDPTAPLTEHFVSADIRTYVDDRPGSSDSASTFDIPSSHTTPERHTTLPEPLTQELQGSLIKGLLAAIWEDVLQVEYAKNRSMLLEYTPSLLPFLVLTAGPTGARLHAF